MGNLNKPPIPSDKRARVLAKTAPRGCFIYGLRISGEPEYFYVGSSLDVKTRLCSHRSSVKTHTHRNVHLMRKWLNAGLDAVTLEIIEEVDQQTRSEREYYRIKKLLDEGVKLTNFITKQPDYDGIRGKVEPEYGAEDLSNDFINYAKTKHLINSDIGRAAGGVIEAAINFFFIRHTELAKDYFGKELFEQTRGIVLEN